MSSPYPISLSDAAPGPGFFSSPITRVYRDSANTCENQYCFATFNNSGRKRRLEINAQSMKDI
jgi:hypothetical protein